jgi:anti-sigma factor RsiW
MTGHERPGGEDALHAYIDGELAAGERAAFERRMAADPALGARVAAYAADKAMLAAVFRPVGERKLPPAWAARIAADGPAPRLPQRQSGRRNVLFALAACVLAIAGGWWAGLLHPSDSILADAAAARDHRLAPVRQLAGAALPPGATRDALLHDTLHLNVRAPDLAKFGYRLVELDTYSSWRGGPAAGLRYRDANARELTIYVRASSGEARFDLLRSGALRVCIWQDDVVGAVMTGQMSAGEMMRIASAAYSGLDL